MNETPDLPLLIDSHAHLDHNQYDADRDAVIVRARNGAISHILTVGCDLASSRASVALAQSHADIYASVGIHPHDALDVTDEALDELRRLAQDQPKVVAIGEIGLDFYRDRAPRESQRNAFRRQIALAREVQLPLIVHDRDAHAEVLAILREEGADAVGGVLHCFSGDLAMARACLDLGFYLSFPGTVTYPANAAAREIVRAIPDERLLLETDCPYLAPQPQRGRRNEPAFVRMTAEAVAAMRGVTVADIARITSRNAHTLFGLGAEEGAAPIAYRIRHSLYLNITNRCTNSCTFCPKFSGFVVKGHQLRLHHEPTAAEVIAAIGDPTSYNEVVFCGYGEPLLRLDLVKAVATWLKGHGVKVRINSDGQANLVHGRDILPELAGLVDTLSVSLNAADAATYQQLCHSRFGEAGYEGIKAFIRAAQVHIPEVVASIVTVPGLDLAACRRVASELGVPLREREYDNVG
ncbi:MAG: radical SAM protein [Desulfuromonadales bacterium GWC2_61_20]|nr:MAG: radical SAM protein [Desulfuromonadales bacterium GWC2_61_20]HAD03261.1 radical SAM protein [Desulfuromonas sp.]HBT82646.1 radical SAM protein [Desulfuromonas sp.]